MVLPREKHARCRISLQRSRTENLMGTQRQPQGNQNDQKRMPGQDKDRSSDTMTRGKHDDMRQDQKGSSKPSRTHQQHDEDHE
jgi:hypothetical protein